MKKTAVNIPFELHLTINDLLNERLSRFVVLCEKYKGKSLIIELSRGKVSKQPMFSKVIQATDTEQAMEKAKDYLKEFVKENFPITRLKIETPIEFSDALMEVGNLTETYFEWHGKVNPEEIKNLSKLCVRHKCHLSKNSIKKEDLTRFLTLREYGAKELFQVRVEKLIKDLVENGGTIFKEESEYCVYDNNVLLDEGWLTE